MPISGPVKKAEVNILETYNHVNLFVDSQSSSVLRGYV